MKKHVAAYAVLALSFLTILALGSIGKINAQMKLSGKFVRIGFLNPFSGLGASLGAENKIAIDIAQEEINSSGGIGGVPLEIVKYDTGGKAEEAINSTKKLFSKEEVLAILGPYFSFETEVTFPVANRLEIVMVSEASAAPGISAKNRPWAFRNTLTSLTTIEPAFKKYLQMHGPKTVAIITDAKDALAKGEVGNVFPYLLKKHDITNILKVTHITGDLDYSAQVTKIKDANPDGIIISSLYTDAASIAREIRRQGMKQPILTGIGAAAPYFIKLAGQAAEGVIMGQPFWADNPNEKTRRFVVKYKERSGDRPPPHYSAIIYDNLYIMKKVIEEEAVTNKPEDLSLDREKIMRGWSKLKNFPGVAGLTSIGPDGDAIRDVYVTIVRDKKFELLQ